MTYSETKFFTSDISLQDLVDKINKFCFDNEVDLTAVSHDQNDSFLTQYPSATGAMTPIADAYKPTTIYTAIIAYTKKKVRT